MLLLLAGPNPKGNPIISISSFYFNLLPCSPELGSLFISKV